MSTTVLPKILLQNVCRLSKRELKWWNSNKQPKKFVATYSTIYLKQHFYEKSNLCSLIGWIVNPIVPLNNDGFVKLPNVRSVKVINICNEMMTFTPTLRSTLPEVLLSHKTYHKTGFNIIVDDLHKSGLGISYTETCFIEDKWAK